MGRETRFDDLARELASGEISRRSALKRLAGGALGLGAAMAPGGVAEAMGGGCPGGRVKCDGKCCPKNARCRNGRCKCKPGFTKCGKKCVDTEISVKHCGGCDDPCDEGRACVGGECTECSAPGECPDPGAGSCQRAVCTDGFCGQEADDTNVPTDVGQCNTGSCESGAPVVAPRPEGTECNESGGAICDGAGACVPCETNADCGGNATVCSEWLCQSGACVTVATDGDFCGITQAGCPLGQVRDRCCQSGACTQICSPCEPP